MNKNTLVVSCLVLSIMLGMILNVNAKENMDNKVKIYLNDIEVDNRDVGLIVHNKIYDGFFMDEIFVPLRTVIEALGAEVVWEESTESIYFSYADIEYICRFVMIDQERPNLKLFLVCRIENKDSDDNSDYIQLSDTDASAAYLMINDRTYLHYYSCQRLLEALGYKMEIDYNTHVIKIFKN